jgi:hypothetical protein
MEGGDREQEPEPRLIVRGRRGRVYQRPGRRTGPKRAVNSTVNDECGTTLTMIFGAWEGRFSQEAFHEQEGAHRVTTIY